MANNTKSNIKKIHRIASKNVVRSREAINVVAASKRLHIFWVSGQKGIS